jgi:PemK-like protein.
MLKPGDVVITLFAYLDGSGAKIRPALVVSCEDHNTKTGNVVMVMISSAAVKNDYEVTIDNWQDASLKMPSKVKIGSIKDDDYEKVKQKLIALLG